MIPRMKNYKVVSIVWEDAWSDAGYFSKESAVNEPPCFITSVGILIENNDNGATIACELFHDTDKFDRYRKVQHIPKSIIREFEVLKNE
jgi:hypothetical protein